MANTFSLKVIACDRIFFDGRCTQVVLPLHDGEKAIQAHHENMVFAVEIGEIRITDENGKEIMGITGTGFAQIINNRATVLVDTCEYPEAFGGNYFWKQHIDYYDSEYHAWICVEKSKKLRRSTRKI